MDDIDDLIAGTSEEKREALYDEMAAVLAAGGDELAQTTIDYCGGVVMRLLELSEPAVRREWAMRLATLEGMPRAFVARLARAEIKIAAPVLSLAREIDEKALIEIASKQSMDHCLAVARRADLTEKVVEALLARGSNELSLEIASNPVARISETSAELLGRQASRCPPLEEVLCGRQDLPEALSHKLMRTVSMRLQLQVGSMMADFDADTTRLALRTNLAESSWEITDRVCLSQNAIVEIARMASGGGIKESDLADCVAKGKTELAVCAFARLAKLEPAVARRILLDPAGESLLVAARTIPLSPETFRALIVLVGSVSEEDADKRVEEYEAIEVRTARKVMAFHMRRRRIASTRRSETARPHEIGRTAAASA